MERVGRHATELVARRWLSPGTLECRLRRPQDFTFIPGQFLRFEMDGYSRDYTMISVPDDATLDFCIAIVDQGRFGGHLLQAPLGSSFRLSGPHGRFVFQGAAPPAVFVATGTGVAPFVAFCRTKMPGLDNSLLLHGVGDAQGLIYRHLLQSRIGAYVACISRTISKLDPPGAVYPGRVTAYLAEQLPTGIYDFYLCGRRPMIRDATAIIDLRFGGSRVFTETYD